MKFKFPFEALRKVRKREEEEAQRTFAEAQARLNECLEGIQNMYKKIDETRLEISRLQFSSEKEKIQKIRGLEEFISGQEIRIKRERQRARELMRDAEDKQIILIDRAQKFKIIDRLKEKRHEAFKKEARDQERAELDEIVTLRSKKRKAL